MIAFIQENPVVFALIILGGAAVGFWLVKRSQRP